MTKKNQKIGLLILGMHRSGTSALTRVLSLHGYELPKNVTGQSEGNETGHWESALIEKLNTEIFEKFGLTWFSWSPMRLEELNTKEKIQLIEDFEHKLQAEFPGNKDFVLKDPRLCRTAPLVLKAFNNIQFKPKIIIPLRNPLEVADSLGSRNNISKEQSALIWLRYTLNAEHKSRGYDRVFTFFDEFLKSPKDTLQHIFKTLKISPPTSFKNAEREIDRFLNTSLKHHSYYRDDLILDSAMRGWVSRTFFTLTKLKDNPNDRKVLSELDIIREEFNVATPIFETILNSSFGEQQQKINIKTQQIVEIQNEIKNLSQNLEAKNAKLIKAQSDIEQFNLTLKIKSQETKALERSLESRSLELEEKTKSLNDSNQRLEQLGGELSQLSGTLMQRNQEILEKGETLDKSEKKIKVIIQEKNFLQSEIKSLNAKSTDREVKISKLNSSISNYENVIKSYTDQINVEKIASSALRADLEQLKQLHEHQIYQTEQAILDYQARDTEVRHLRSLLAYEQRTVVKPALRRLRSFGGTALRAILPNTLVESLAFKIPTAEQKLILENRARENTTSNISIKPQELSNIKVSNSKPDIFIFAIIGWHFRTQRPQHIARELSKLGHRVFYFEMDPPGEHTEIEQLGERLYRIKLKLEGVPQIPAYSGTPTAAQEKAWLKGFYDFCDEFKASPYKNLIVQHPFWWQLAKLLPPEFHTLYDCMDDIGGFANSDQKLIDLEHQFLENCDDLVVSGSTLMHKYKRYNPLQIIRNATEIDHFQNPDQSKLTPKFTAKPLVKGSNIPIKVGYVGAIADWFDTEMLKEAARARPDIEFHFCGNISADHPHTLKKEPNIYMYGEIPYEQVPAFLAQMDVVTIPFKILPIIQACDPVKFYEYSALGKPTVTTPLPELTRADHLAFFARDAQEFISQIDNAYKMKDDTDFIEELQEFAKNNTWSHRAEQFYDVLNTHPKISIIVLAYGDPKLTNATINSLKSQGDTYPNMEIIIVDNGSPVESIKAMRDQIAKFDNVRIIENGENLGFAAGNNVGLQAATGEYIMLLNNDTYVSPGSLQAMMLHLKNNPDIGAIGPLTNNIGNEAKLPIDYASMEEMALKTRALKTGYRGKNFETAVVAYFAVMFRQSDIESFGHLSTDYGRGMFEDDDHCRVIRSKGFICAVAEDAFVHHHLSATFSKINDSERQKLFDDNKATFERKWGTWKPHEYRDGRLISDLQFSNEELF